MDLLKQLLLACLGGVLCDAVYVQDFPAGAASTAALAATRKPDKGNLSGLRVAVIGVHAEGNLGDEMETTPLLRKLHEWGVEIHAYSHSWKPEDPHLRLHSRAVRLLAFVKSFSLSVFKYDVDAKQYDIVISAPGPTIHACPTSQEPTRMQILAFGSSIGSGRSLDRFWCYKSIWVRETHSLSFLRKESNNSSRFRFSGDLSHSFELVPAIVEYWRLAYVKHMTAIFGSRMTCSIIFTRGNNWGRGVGIDAHSRMLRVVTLNSDGSTALKYLHLDHVIFATSDPDADAQHFEMLKKQGINTRQLIMLQSIEEMYGLLSAVDDVHIYSDRYHPGVASHRLMKNVSIISAGKVRATKLQGLSEVIALPAPSMRSANTKAFEELHAHLYDQVKG